jgi:hypothetical protein
VEVRYALDLAKNIEAKITINHIVDYDTLIRFGQKSTAPSSFQPPGHCSWRDTECLISFLKDYVSDLTPGVKVRGKVELGTPDKSIVELASEGYDPS